MKEEVAKAVQAIRTHFATLRVDVIESPCGGAWVLIHDAPLGPPYAQETTWIGFFITNACPYADTYPFYVRADLSRQDGTALKVPLHANRQWEFGPPPSTTSRAAVMVSRVQRNAQCLGRETPLIKLQTVLKWMLAQ
jgi:hypothetical protein